MLEAETRRSFSAPPIELFPDASKLFRMEFFRWFCFSRSCCSASLFSSSSTVDAAAPNASRLAVAFSILTNAISLPTRWACRAASTALTTAAVELYASTCSSNNGAGSLTIIFSLSIVPSLKLPILQDTIRTCVIAACSVC